MNRQSRGGVFWILSLPPAVWLLVLLVGPLLLMTLFSFRTDIKGGIGGEWIFTLKHYSYIFQAKSYLILLGISIFLALCVAIIVTILAYPLAYFLAFHAGRKAEFYLIVLMVPFWTSYLLRVMSWKVMLGADGVINSLLIYLGIIENPSPLLLYSRYSVALTLIYIWIPFAALPILSALQRIDISLFEAAADLGAKPSKRFLTVVLPLSLSGILASFFMVFIPTIGEYATPLIIGGSRGAMYGNLIQEFFTKAANWPLGSALSIVMLLITLILVAIALKQIDFKKFVN